MAVMPPKTARRPCSRGEVIADGIVHGAAIIAAIVAMALLILAVATRHGAPELPAAIVYGCCLVAMLGFSAAYNLTPESPARWLLRRLDHVGIYLAIAGTYTPFVTQFQDAVWSWALGGLVWAAAAIGSLFKLMLPGRLERLSTGLYLLLGWAGAMAIRPMLDSLPVASIVLVFAGGLLYTAGVAFHHWESLKFQNAIWHGFVVAAAGCHYAAVTICIA